MNIEALRKVLPTLPAKDQSFAQSLIAQFELRGSLSEKQAYWVDKLAAGAAPRPEPVQIDTWGIRRIFDTAMATLKRPAIVIDGLRLSIAGPKASVPGSINVTTAGAFEDRTWFGRILEDGTFKPSKDATPEVIEALKAFAANPAAHAAAHGHKTGSCCFCNRELTDERSVAVGYGPICAGHYGLPWGA